MFFRPASEFASRMCASTLSGFTFSAFSARTFASSNLPPDRSRFPGLHLHVVTSFEQVRRPDVFRGALAEFACLPERFRELEPNLAVLGHRLNRVAVLDRGLSELLLAAYSSPRAWCFVFSVCGSREHAPAASTSIKAIPQAGAKRQASGTRAF